MRSFAQRTRVDTKTGHFHATSLARVVLGAGLFAEPSGEFLEAIRSDYAAHGRPAEDREAAGHLNYSASTLAVNHRATGPRDLQG